jgi:hypothetical protein
MDVDSGVKSSLPDVSEVTSVVKATGTGQYVGDIVLCLPVQEIELLNLRDVQ